MPNVLGWAGFRTHILLAHDVAGSIIGNRPTWTGLEVQAVPGGEFYLRHNEPVMRVATRTAADRHGRRTVVTVHALKDVWLQEPGLTVTFRVGGMWRAIHRAGHLGPVVPLPRERDAHKQTEHFSRVETSHEYTVGVQWQNTPKRCRIRSDGGFAVLLDQPVEPVPWQGCEVFGEAYDLAGTVDNRSGRPLRRWELAAHRDEDRMHFLGWTGGAGAVTNEDGKTPPPGTDVQAGDGYDQLWDPRSWRRLGRGQALEQTLVLRWLAAAT